MRDDAYSSIISAILISWTDDRQKQRAFEYIDHARKQFAISKPKHDTLLQQALRCQVYVLEVVSQLTNNENLVISIFNDQTSRQYTINSGETYRLDLGTHINYKLKFSVAKFNGENRKAIVRSSSLIKRVMLLDRKEDENIQLNSFQLNIPEKRCVEHKNHCYTIELKLIKENRPELASHFDFNDFLELIQTLHEKDAMSKGICEEYTGELCDKSQFILDAAIDLHNLPHVIIPIITLSIFLVWDNSIRSFDETIIADLINDIKGYQTFTNSTILENALCYLSECVEAEMTDLLDRFHHLSLFPPQSHQSFKQLNSALKTVIDICVLPIWDTQNTTTFIDPSNILTSALQKMLVNNCNEWIEELKNESEDIKQACLSIHAMSDLLQHNYQCASLFYHQFFIDYIRVSLETIDKKLEEISRAYISNRLDSLNSRSSEELELFSKCTMRFYETLASISQFARRNHVDELRLHDYEAWFSPVTVYWTFSWRELSSRMVERTISLEEDNDDNGPEQKRPLPAGIYSFLCIQKGLSDDYTTLSFNRSENITTATTALINIFCENTCSYGKKLFTEALTKEDGIERRIVRAINGIEQSSDYIRERWKTFVRWDTQKPKIAEEEADSILKFVQTAMDSAQKRCEHLIGLLVIRGVKFLKDSITRIARSITLDTAEYMKTFKSYRRDISQLERFNSVMDNVDQLVDTLRSKLLSKSFAMSLRYVFELLEQEIEKHLKKCQPSEYYSNIYVTIKALLDLLELPITHSKIINTLHYRSFSTQELILSYFSYLSDFTNDAQICNDTWPFIRIQIGHIKTLSDNVLVIINVCDIINLPILNPLCDRRDLYVKLELFPRILFPDPIFAAQKTKILTSYREKTWNQTFQFLIPENHFYMYGVSLCIAVFDHSRICDHLLGRTFVSATRLPLLPSTCIQSNPVVSYPLLRPSIGHSHPFFQMLRERARYDVEARHFLSREQTAREMYVKLKRLSNKISIKKNVFQLTK